MKNFDFKDSIQTTLESTLQHYQGLLDKASNINPKKIQQDGQKKLKDAKDALIEQIEEYFFSQEEKLNESIDKLNNKDPAIQNDYYQIYNDLQLIISQLNGYLQKYDLDKKEEIKNIVESQEFKNKNKEITDQMKQQVENYQKRIDISNHEVIVNKGKKKAIDQELSQYAYFKGNNLKVKASNREQSIFQREEINQIGGQEINQNDGEEILRDQQSIIQFNDIFSIKKDYMPIQNREKSQNKLRKAGNKLKNTSNLSKDKSLDKSKEKSKDKLKDKSKDKPKVKSEDKSKVITKDKPAKSLDKSKDSSNSSKVKSKDKKKKKSKDKLKKTKSNKNKSVELKDSPINFLHYFQDNSKNLYIINLEKLHSSIENNEKINKEEVITMQELKIDFRIPVFHKSIATRLGDIYLIGGTELEGKKEITNKVYIYNKIDSKSQLINGAQMNVERSSHSVCELNNQIYVIGGITQNDGYTNTCEKLDYSFSSTWQKIASCYYKAAFSTIVPFKNRLIFKYGGKQSPQGEIIDKVECYHAMDDMWIPINISIKEDISMLDIPLDTYMANGIQRNDEEIFIFGGYSQHKNFISAQSFILNFKYDDVIPPKKAKPTKIGEYQVVTKGAFWNQNIVYQSTLYCLQMIPSNLSASTHLLDKRRILSFNGNIWKEITL